LVQKLTAAGEAIAKVVERTPTRMDSFIVICCWTLDLRIKVEDSEEML
jgi:hypothetical protein